jgi:proteasome accessory factor B
VGHDGERAAPRVFRLSRIVGVVTAVGEPGAVVRPDGVDLRAMVARMATDEPRETARVSLRPGSGSELRREAPPAPRTRTGRAGRWWSSGFSDPEWFADRITGFGADAVVLGPPAARDAVVRRLEALAS